MFISIEKNSLKSLADTSHFSKKIKFAIKWGFTIIPEMASKWCHHKMNFCDETWYTVTTNEQDMIAQKIIYYNLRHLYDEKVRTKLLSVTKIILWSWGNSHLNLAHYVMQHIAKTVCVDWNAKCRQTAIKFMMREEAIALIKICDRKNSAILIKKGATKHLCLGTV